MQIDPKYMQEEAEVDSTVLFKFSLHVKTPFVNYFTAMFIFMKLHFHWVYIHVEIVEVRMVTMLMDMKMYLE
jgi:hypothetical protein